MLFNFAPFSVIAMSNKSSLNIKAHIRGLFSPTEAALAILKQFI